jgi:hypothetical protein
MEKRPGASSGDAKQELVVFIIRKDSRCAECGKELWRGSFLRTEGEKGLCLECADLDHLEFLPSGDTAITRRATKYSKLRAVVVQWSRMRKRYERQGILAEAEAIRRAEEESLADADLRARRREQAAFPRNVEDREFSAGFARAIRGQYPSCPTGEETRKSPNTPEPPFHQAKPEAAIKGPRGKSKFDIRRLWECPICHRRELTPGSVVNRVCICVANQDPPRQTWMRLIEEPVKRPVPRPQPPPVPNALKNGAAEA